MREAGIIKIEQDGPETCELPANSSFVAVRVPLRIEGEDPRGETTFHYSIGSFFGREATLEVQAGSRTVLRFRIPLELFRTRERVLVEVRAGDSAHPPKLLWTKRWEVAWPSKLPSLDPVAE